MLERTFAMIKPDAVKANRIGAILQAIQSRGFEIIGLYLHTLSALDTQTLYRDHRGRPYYDRLISFITSGPVVLLVLERDQAVSQFRLLLGATNPAHADPCTLRAQFGTDIPSNAVHGSDSQASANREIHLFFKASELHSPNVMTGLDHARTPETHTAA